ncbi:MAG: hypothetical protein WCA49_21785 [Candidatus Sulfotelmatobacter sp.]
MSAEAKSSGLRWEKITAISTFVLAITGPAALMFTGWQIREARNAAQVQHEDELVRRWDYEMGDVRKALALKRLDPKREALLPLDVESTQVEMETILDFYEHMDVMVDRGYVDKNDVWRDFSSDMFPFYADAHAYIDQAEKDSPSTWFGFTELMEDMRKEEISDNDGAEDHPSPEDILSFYQYEVARVPGVPTPRERTKSKHQVKKTSQ